MLYVHGVRGLALAETRPAHWVIVLHLGLEGCSQPRELWFVDILVYRSSAIKTNGVGNRRDGPGSCFLTVRHYHTIQKAHCARKQGRLI